MPCTPTNRWVKGGSVKEKREAKRLYRPLTTYSLANCQGPGRHILYHRRNNMRELKTTPQRGFGFATQLAQPTTMACGSTTNMHGYIIVGLRGHPRVLAVFPNYHGEVTPLASHQMFHGERRCSFLPSRGGEEVSLAIDIHPSLHISIYIY